MKMKTLLFFAAVVSCSAAMAAPLAVDTREIRLQGGIDFDGANGTEIGLEGGYGIFIADYLEVGGNAGIFDSDDFSTYEVSGFAEYNFELVYEGVVPFLGGEVGFAKLDADGFKGNSAVTFAGYTGLKLFITESLAITPRFKIELATDDIYPEEKKLNDVDMVVDLGLRYFF